jgi:hypothetical protein
MATGAGLAEWEQTHGKKKAKCVLTSTGLLMEGLSRSHLNSAVELGCLDLLLSFCLSLIFHREISCQDRLATTIANSVDP